MNEEAKVMLSAIQRTPGARRRRRRPTATDFPCHTIGSTCLLGRFTSFMVSHLQTSKTNRTVIRLGERRPLSAPPLPHRPAVAPGTTQTARSSRAIVHCNPGIAGTWNFEYFTVAKPGSQSSHHAEIYRGYPWSSRRSTPSRTAGGTPAHGTALRARSRGGRLGDPARQGEHHDRDLGQTRSADRVGRHRAGGSVRRRPERTTKAGREVGRDRTVIRDRLERI